MHETFWLENLIKISPKLLFQKLPAAKRNRFIWNHGIGSSTPVGRLLYFICTSFIQKTNNFIRSCYFVFNVRICRLWHKLIQFFLDISLELQSFAWMNKKVYKITDLFLAVKTFLDKMKMNLYNTFDCLQSGKISHHNTKLISTKQKAFNLSGKIKFAA